MFARCRSFGWERCCFTATLLSARLDLPYEASESTWVCEPYSGPNSLAHAIQLTTGQFLFTFAQPQQSLNGFIIVF